MSRFIQQQIPPTPVRSVPATPCPACQASGIRPAATKQQEPEPETSPGKAERKAAKRKNKK